MKNTYWEDTDAQQLMRSIVRLSKSHPHFDPGDIENDLEDCTECSMTKKDINKLLKKFVDDCLVKKTQNDVDVRGGSEYEVAQKNFFYKFINPDEGEMPSEEDMYEFSSEEESDDSSLDGDIPTAEVVDSDEDIPTAEVVHSDEDADESNKSLNPVFDGGTRSTVSPSAAIRPGNDGVAPLAISPEKLSDDLAAKRKAATVTESETSKKSKYEVTNPDEGKVPPLKNVKGP